MLRQATAPAGLGFKLALPGKSCEHQAMQPFSAQSILF
jgi:hypothetical protein